MDTLLQVVTITEAARMWRKHNLTVRRAIDARQKPLIARKSDNVWLINYESCVRRWGEPKEPASL
jgi:hypothetical protein